MLKESSEQGALTDPPPVERCFVDEEIEEGIIGGGNGAPEAGLPRFLLLTLGQLPCLLEQVVGIWHRQLCPSWVLDLIVFRKAAEIKKGV